MLENKFKGFKVGICRCMSDLPYDNANRIDELEYTHLGQLKEIITCKNNLDLFLPYFKIKNKQSFQEAIDKTISPRNAIGHCIPLRGDDYKFADLRC